MLINKASSLRVFVAERSIGPAHDPYGATTVRITLPHGTYAEKYTDGLGFNRVELVKGNELVRHEEWHDAHVSAGQFKAKCAILCKRTVGITFDDAEEAYNNAQRNQPADPARFER